MRRDFFSRHTTTDVARPPNKIAFVAQADDIFFMTVATMLKVSHQCVKGAKKHIDALAV